MKQISVPSKVKKDIDGFIGTMCDVVTSIGARVSKKYQLILVCQLDYLYKLAYELYEETGSGFISSRSLKIIKKSLNFLPTDIKDLIPKSIIDFFNKN